MHSVIYKKVFTKISSFSHMISVIYKRKAFISGLPEYFQIFPDMFQIFPNKFQVGERVALLAPLLLRL